MSSQPEPDFTMQDLMREIAGTDLDVDLGDKMTTRDFKDFLNVGTMKTARERIKPLVEAGILVPTRDRRENMAGYMSVVPAYAVNPTATWEEALKVLGG